MDPQTGTQPGGIEWRRSRAPVMYEAAVEAMEQRVANGDLPPEHMQRIEDFYSGPGGTLLTVGMGTVSIAALSFLAALLVWFAVGFILGAPFRYRHALEVTTWSSLVTLPPTVLSMVLAWIRQDMRGVHVGFAILLPEAGPGDRMLRSLGVFLDWIGPFGIWHAAVAVLGAAYISGAPRKSVAWALGSLYVVCGLVAAALAALIPAGA